MKNKRDRTIFMCVFRKVKNIWIYDLGDELEKTCVSRGSLENTYIITQQSNVRHAV